MVMLVGAVRLSIGSFWWYFQLLHKLQSMHVPFTKASGGLVAKYEWLKQKYALKNKPSSESENNQIVFFL